MDEPWADAVARRSTQSGAGPTAAATAALAAELVAFVAGCSLECWPGARRVNRKATDLAHVCRRFALSDAEVLRDARAALAGRTDAEDRDYEIARLLDETVAQLAEVVDVAGDIAALASQCVHRADQDLRVDALGAVILAIAAAEIGTELIAINLGVTPGDPRLVDARERVASAQMLRRSLPDLT